MSAHLDSNCKDRELAELGRLCKGLPSTPGRGGGENSSKLLSLDGPWTLGLAPRCLWAGAGTSAPGILTLLSPVPPWRSTYLWFALAWNWCSGRWRWMDSSHPLPLPTNPSSMALQSWKLVVGTESGTELDWVLPERAIWTLVTLGGEIALLEASSWACAEGQAL